MIDITREFDLDLEVDVLALQALPTPTGLFSPDLAGLGGKNTCQIVTVTCCQTCTKQTVCKDTIG